MGFMMYIQETITLINSFIVIIISVEQMFICYICYLYILSVLPIVLLYFYVVAQFMRNTREQTDF